MRWFLAASMTAVLALSQGAASATESTLLAIEAGFLLGHAQRCGVKPGRVEALAEELRGAIAAAARDDQDQKTAGSRFALVFLATSMPAKDQHALVPSCRTIVAEFRRLERHSLPAMGE